MLIGIHVNRVFAFPIDYFHRFWKDRICISKYFLSLQQDGICQHPPYSPVWTSHGHLPDKQPETELGGNQTTFSDIDADADTDIRGIRKIGKNKASCRFGWDKVQYFLRSNYPMHQVVNIYHHFIIIHEQYFRLQ